MLPTVVIAGRPNVGKSTLFNRLVGRRDAIVSDTPGVTRDRKEGEALLRGKRVRLVDTAGLEEAAPESLPGRMRASSEAAVSEADLVLFVVDARAGITPADAHFAAWLRKQGRPVLLVANKAEGRSGAAAALEAYSLGLGEPLAMSASSPTVAPCTTHRWATVAPGPISHGMSGGPWRTEPSWTLAPARTMTWE